MLRGGAEACFSLEQPHMQLFLDNSMHVSALSRTPIWHIGACQWQVSFLNKFRITSKRSAALGGACSCGCYATIGHLVFCLFGDTHEYVMLSVLGTHRARVMAGFHGR